MDAYEETRALRAQYLRARAKVRALAASLVAAQARLQREARSNADPEMAVLMSQLQAQRVAFDEIASDLDARLRAVTSAGASAGTARLAEIRAQARRRLRRVVLP